ncbi:MAG TPA: hypothetical protein VF230_16890 [Acidimicrobiales bacterium]
MESKARALVAAVVVVLATLVPMSPPASAASGVVVCAVAGTVNVSVGVWRIPPASVTPSGQYSFENVALVCVGANDNPLPPPAGQGTMTGVGNATSNGDFGSNACGGVNYPWVGSFCGTYDATNFTSGGECHGSVGGNEMAMATAPPFGDEDTLDEQVAAGDWSITFGPLILGGITCDTGSYDDSTGGVLDGIADHDGVGTLALVTAPVVTSLGSPPPPLPGGWCRPPTPSATAWFCQITVAGVAVMESLGATPATMGVTDAVTDTLPSILQSLVTQPGGSAR